MPRINILFSLLFAILLLWSMLISTASAQRIEDVDNLEGVGVEERLEAALPLDLTFRNSLGKSVSLGDYFQGSKPVLLSLNYSDCPMLCRLQLNGLVDGFRQMKMEPGRDFDIISVSIDPLETPQRSRQTKQHYLKSYGRPKTSDGWHFLCGDKRSIAQLAESVGFHFKYVPERKEYAHAAVTIAITPTGIVSRYLYGVVYPPRTLRLSLVEAAEGKIGSTLDRVLLFCLHYDATTGRYAPVARNLMRLGASVTLGALALTLLPFWFRRRGSQALTRNEDSTAGATAARGEVDDQTIACRGVAPLFLLGAIGDPLFPKPTSTTAGTVDDLFYFILIISIGFFAIIVGAMLLFIFRYRERPGHEVQPSPSHNNLLEVGWSVFPGILVGVIFFWGFTTYLDMRQPPDNSYEIQVIAKKWTWSFVYPNGHVDNDLHVPVGKPVRLVMSSDDVIHSLYIPSFRLKMDVIPGRYTSTWFESNAPGDYVLFCAEYCGTQHSKMLARVVVHPSGEFNRWLENAANFMEKMTPAEAGQTLYTRRGCVQCHSLDGSAMTGPSFKGVYSSIQAMANGESITVDENYLRESILEPQAKVRAGYKPVMPTYQGQLKNEEIAALIAFIKSLSEEPKP